MEITPQALEIVTGRSERLNNRAANAYVISGNLTLQEIQGIINKE